MDRPAKPAYNKVKVRALKLLKDMAKQQSELIRRLKSNVANIRVKALPC